MKPEAHGGDLLRLSEKAGREPASLLDFSVNIRPEGAPEFIRAALFQSMTTLSAYPSPHAEEAMLAAASYHKIDSDCFVFGNGSNELIHTLARVLKNRGVTKACIIEPAFSEYALACRAASLDVISIWGGMPDLSAPKQATNPSETNSAQLTSNKQQVSKTKQQINNTQNLLKTLQEIPSNTAVFLANPANPSGHFHNAETCLHLIAQRPDLFWIIDEAFIEYAGNERTVSILHRLPANTLVLRSLTKFYAVPGVRLGYLVSNNEVANAIRTALPAWTVNAFAIKAAQAVFADTSDFAEITRNTNTARRADLEARLASIKNLQLYPSVANYVLFRCPDAPSNLHTLLLQGYGIAIRDCSNYYGLHDGTWFRAAVRFSKDHHRLAKALQEILQNTSMQSDIRIATQLATSPSTKAPEITKKKPALMLQGTSSNAGKSILAAAYCRIFQQDGYRVAPFKAQNMSLNSGVTAKGDEMGRAQIVQAQAARIDPEARMNPILLKPHSDTGSQVIVMGQAIGHMAVAEYFAKKKELWQTVTDAYDSLATDYDIIVLEGAGSPAEINLKDHDVVNMRIAEHANASVLLVGDIDRGGIYASFLGTWMTFTDTERRLLTGYIVNRFRGDASYLEPAHTYMHNHTGVPVLGTIPYIRDLNIPEEDMAGFSWGQSTDNTPKEEGILDIAVIMLRHVSNYTDVAPLDIEGDVRLRPIRRLEEWGDPDVLILPGSKSVVPDLEDLQNSGLAEKILEHAKHNKWIFGICGGLQIMGREIRDPYAVESNKPTVSALNLMELYSTFAADKTLVHVDKAETPLGVLSGGYEIHHGVTEHGPSALPLFLRTDRAYDSEEERICGYVTGRRWATYLHGIFDNDTFRRAWINYVRADLGIAPHEHTCASYNLEQAIDRLADIVRETTDMQHIYKSMGL